MGRTRTTLRTETVPSNRFHTARLATSGDDRDASATVQRLPDASLKATRHC
jgi:hypothetical protein